MPNKRSAAAFASVLALAPAFARAEVPQVPSPSGPAASAPSPAAAYEDVIPSVEINGTTVADGVAMLRVGNEFFATISDLRSWHVHVAPSSLVIVNGLTYASLAANGFRDIVFDPAKQHLSATLSADRFEFASANQLAYENVPRGQTGPSALAPRSSSAFAASYSLTADAGLGFGTGLFGRFDTSSFIGPGELKSGFVTSLSSSQTGAPPFERLDTSYAIDDQRRLRRLIVGDSTTSNDETGAPMRFAGVQWGTNFELDPRFVAYPTPTVRGTAYLPSTVQVFANGTLIATQRVGPGDFALPNLPLTGSGSAQVVVRDQSGQIHEIDQSYVASPTLLRRGLHQYDLSTGFAHLDAGTSTDHYGPLVTEASESYGLTDRVTLVSHLEAGDGVGELSELGRFGIARAGIFGLGYARSFGMPGSALIGDYSYSGDRFGIGGHIVDRSSGFQLVGDRLEALSDPLVGISFDASATLRLARGTSLTATTAQENRALSGRTGYQLVQLQRSIRGNLLTLGYESVRSGTDASHTIEFDYAFALGPTARAEADAGFGGGGDRRLAYSDDTREGRSGALLEASLEGDEGTTPYLTLDRAIPLRYADFGYGFVAGNGGASGELQLSGSFVDADGRVTPAPAIGDSFVVVNAGHAGVRVKINGYDVGRSDAHGYLATSQIAPLVQNTVSLDGSDFVGGAVADLTRTFTPPLHGAVFVTFPTRRPGAVTLHFVRSDGGPIPVGSVISFENLQWPTGEGGLAYLSPVSPGPMRVHVDLGFHRSCDAALTLPGDLSEAPDLGDVPCVVGNGISDAPAPVSSPTTAVNQKNP